MVKALRFPHIHMRLELSDACDFWTELRASQQHRSRQRRHQSNVPRSRQQRQHSSRHSNMPRSRQQRHASAAVGGGGGSGDSSGMSSKGSRWHLDGLDVVAGDEPRRMMAAVFALK